MTAHEEHVEMPHDTEGNGSAKAVWWVMGIIATMFVLLAAGFISQANARFDELQTARTDLAVVKQRLDSIEKAQGDTRSDVQAALSILREIQAAKH